MGQMIFIGIYFLIFFLSVPVIVYYFLKDLKDLKLFIEIRKWTKTQAVIVERSILNFGSRSTEAPKLHLVYRYNVGDSIVVSDTISLGRQAEIELVKSVNPGRELMDIMAEILAPGKELKVFYNPNNPKESYVFRAGIGTIASELVFLFMFLSAMIMLGLFVLSIVT